MEIVYAKNDYIERENKRVFNEMKSVLSNCATLDIYCGIENDVLGIWFALDGMKYLVDPLELVNSIYKDDKYYMLEQYPKADGSYRIVEVFKEQYCFFWRVLGDSDHGSRPFYFNFQEYINKIQLCIESLYSEWLTGKTVAYDKFDVDIEGIKVAHEQLNVGGTAPGYYRLWASNVKEELFTFDTTSHKHLEKYSIGIGGRKFDTFITHWDNNFNKIRHQFENFYYDRDAMIELSFDMSNTILKIKKVSMLDEVNESDEGQGFKYRDYALVEIQPNEFVHLPIIKGYCDLGQAIKELYEGLLLFALAHKVDRVDDDEPPLLEIYNMLKSPLVENVINDVKPKWDKPDKRHHHIKQILRIDPVYDVVLFDSEWVSYYIDPEDGTIDSIHDYHGNPVKLPGLVEWQEEISNVIVEAAMGRKIPFDWEDYHKRGLVLAKRLRKVLSPDFDLWYYPPIEDDSGIVSRPMLIYQEG